MMRGSVFKYAESFASASLVVLAMAGFSDAADAKIRQKYYQSEEAPQSTLSGPPVMAVVTLRDQRVSLYDANGNALRAPVSTGQTGLDTPPGVYSVLEKQEEHYSNIFDGASMPFMQRITWSGVALHAGVIPGYPASHGCVRMPYNFAQQIYPLTHLNMRVVINYADVAPVPFSHPLLMKPLPAGEAAIATPAVYENDPSSENTNPFQPDVRNWPAREAQLEGLRSAAAARAVEADDATANAGQLKKLVNQKTVERTRALRVMQYAQQVKKQADDTLTRADRLLLAAKTPAAFKKAEAYKAKLMPAWKDAAAKLDVAAGKFKAVDKEFSDANGSWKSAEAIHAAAVAAEQETLHRTLPISVFISLKNKRLYVRQGNAPVFDAPVTIANPDMPIGTHIFTAVDYTDQGKDLRWTVVSIGKRTAEDMNKARVADLSAAAPPTDTAAASAALDRITIPPEVASRISGYVWPGSSLIVSDEETSKETGKATDFVVLISGEPQGGIKRRPRQYAPRYVDPWDSYDDDGPRGRHNQGGSFFSWW